MTKKVSNFCCERFGEFYNSGEIQYAYERHSGIDVTEWIIDGFAHLNFCPFCGAFVKGHGFGNYDEKYPPSKEIFARQHIIDRIRVPQWQMTCLSNIIIPKPISKTSNVTS